MRLAISGLRRPRPMVLAIAATFCAAALVLYLQHRAISTLESQTHVILRQISEQTATDIALQLRRTLDGPVFDGLTAVNHPELRAGRLDLVAAEYEEALNAYPHVDRFFVWHAQTEAVAPGEVLFYGRDATRRAKWPAGAAVSDRLVRDPALGRAIIDIARRHAPDQHIYAAAEGVGPDARHQVLLRLFWTDARRVEFFAVLGFVVDPPAMRQRLFSAPGGRDLETLLRRRGGDVPLQLRVTDERGAVVYGNAVAQPLAAQVTFPMLFYPDSIASRLSAAVKPRPWTIEVGAPMRDAGLVGVNQGYWPTVLSVVLMLVALGLTVQANRRAEDLARMQTDFISHVSHQLKTPLSLLSAATETMAMERVRSPEKLTQYVEIIRSEVARLSALVQRILESARVQQPREYEFETIDLAALVHETVEAFEGSLLSRSFAFRVQHDGRPLHVSADPAALEQVLANLLDNAVKYSGDAREIIVRVGARGGEAFIEVVDRGVGIPSEDHERIFQKFYRGSAGSLHREGFGLGLPIVQELVQAHGGRVEVDSAPNEGSTFRVLLPAVRAERADAPSDTEDTQPREAVS